jgi:tripartite-type tricarboxylate transporter receptor subunit TctC
MPRTLNWFCAAALLTVAAGPAIAEYPEQPITVIVPFSAGGGTDIGTRTWVPYLERCLGPNTTTVVVNRPGAAGVIGFAEVAKAAPDGYTLGTLTSPNLPLGSITQAEPFYNLDSFEYLGNFFGNGITLSVKRDSPIANIDDLVTQLKSGADLNIGISSIGGDDHLLLLGLEKIIGVKLQPVPFGDGAASRTAVLGGHVDAGTVSGSDALRYAEDIRPLAIATDARVADLADVPTFRESGLDLLAGSRHIIGAPKGLPEEVTAKLSACFESIGKDPQFIADAKERSFQLDVLNAAQTREYIEGEYSKFKVLWESDPWM